VELYYLCVGILGLVVLFGQAKLFEISSTLKEIKALLEKERQTSQMRSESQAPR